MELFKTTIILFLFLRAGKGHFECDTTYKEVNNNDRLFIHNLYAAWPEGAIPYSISKNFTQNDKKLIKESMKYIETVSCVRFIQKNKQQALLLIRPDKSKCVADIGYRGPNTYRFLKLYRGECMHKDVIVHELLHSLGFAHEQCRPDRDKYVKVHWANILEASRYNFYKADDINSTTYYPTCLPSTPINELDDCVSSMIVKMDGLDYDYNSIMHYGSKYFKINGSVTLSARDPKIKIGAGAKLTDLDIQRINLVYPCDSISWVCRDELRECVKFKADLCGSAFVSKCKRTCKKCNPSL